VLPIVLDIARGFNVLRQVDAVVSQRDPNAAQDVPRAGLVVNGIEGGDEVTSALNCTRVAGTIKTSAGNHVDFYD
jgi:hypothetical protein